MKSINRILLITLALLVGFACSEDFLEEAGVPQDAPGGDNFYDSPGTIYFGAMGVYSILHDLYDETNAIPEALEKRSDNTADDGDETVPDRDFRGGGQGGGVWNQSFRMISRANLVLESIETFSGTEREEAQLLPLEAEMRFLRAFAYFNLVRMFGDMIIITEPLTNDQEILEKRRSPVSQVYEEVIIPDLQFAVENTLTKEELAESSNVPGRFQDGSELGRASQAAARTALGEVYLTLAQYAEAEQVLSEVYNSGLYVLEPSYEDLFDVSNEYNQESIWEIGFDFAAGVGSRYYRWTTRALRDETGTQGAVGIMLPTKSILDAFLNVRDDSGNVLPVRDTTGTYANLTRFSVSMDTLALHKGNPNDTVFADYIKKFVTLGIEAQNVNQDNNYYVYRFADVILMLAEARNNLGKTGEAISLLNEVRMRANMPLYDYDRWDGGGGRSPQEAFSDALLFERRIEFAFESKRWFDLLRFEAATEVMSDYVGFPIEERLLLFEIPNDEIDKNPGITQNPGY